MLRIKNDRLLDWIRRALKESNKVEESYYLDSIESLNKQQQRIKKRLSRLYDDKLDGLVTAGFYEQKYQEYVQEQNTIISKLSKANTVSNSTQDLKISLYDVAQNAKDIYMSEKDMVKKRKLLVQVFKKIWLNEGVVTYEYTEPFKVLSNAVAMTNISSKEAEITEFLDNNFEPSDFASIVGNKGDSETSCPIWLGNRDSNPNFRDQNPTCYPYTIPHR